MKKNNSIFFAILLGFSALSLCFVAALFSVTGLAMLYNLSIYIIIAMSVIEGSKIIVASLLYRYWNDLVNWLKTYLFSALIILMIITSGGIYGYMTHNYIGATVGLDKINSQLQLLEYQKENLIVEQERLINDIAIMRSERQSTIENRNNEISANNMTTDSISVKYRTWRNSQVHKRYNIELLNIDNNVTEYTNNLNLVNIKFSKINNNIADKKLEIIDSGIEIGPLIYMARIFNTNMDTIMKWFTLIIVLVFDPLAIILIVALNIVIEKIKIEKQQIEIKKQKTNQEKSINKKIDDIKKPEISIIEKQKTNQEKSINKKIDDIKELELPIIETNKTENIKNVVNDISSKISIDKIKNNNNFKDEKNNKINDEVKNKIDDEKKDKIINPEDIEIYFDNAVKEVKKKQLGQIEESMYAPGGGIRVNKYKDVVKKK